MGGGINFFISKWGQTFSQKGEQRIYVLGGGGYDDDVDVDEEMDVSEANILMREARKLQKLKF